MNRAERLRLASSPQYRPRGHNLFLALSTASILAAVFLAAVRPTVAAIIGLPGLFFVLYLLYAKALLLTARLGDIRGVVVTSDSPLWKDWIETQWLPRLAPFFIVLNWSRRHEAQPRSLVGWRLHKLFIGNYREFCRAVIVLRGVRYPALFRFYRAFKEFSQGRPEALATLEGELFRNHAVH